MLTFDLGAGGANIAGSPVNITSKLAQDVAAFGSIYVSSAAHEATGRRGDALSRQLEIEVSGVRLAAVVL